MALFFFKCALCLYLLGSLGYLLFIVFQIKSLARISYLVLFLGFLSHSLSIGLWSFQNGYLPVHNLRESLSFFAWAIIGVYLLIQLRSNILVLGSFLSPLASVMMISSSFLPLQTETVNPLIRNLWLMIHVGTIFVGNGVFAVAFLAGIMYLIQERQIKSKHFGPFYHRLPSLEVLDSLNYNCLILGFPLLTLGMVSGAVFAQYTLGTFWRWDPKEVWSLITWLIYAVLLHGRLVAGWRGRRSAMISIIGFLVLTLSFLGGIFLVKGYHSFSAFRTSTPEVWQTGPRKNIEDPRTKMR
ncbi:MAG: c-type cytochrome biogenesis protein CcsB [Desulfobacca sp.]|nr:c-type cytochrome biogenesis protein CcsB [Desulfobacca sp.]